VSRPTRLPGFDYCGCHRYFLTFCTADRHHAFGNANAVAAVLRQIRRTARTSRFALSAYCFMPDHVHLLVEGRNETADLCAFVRRSKQASGQAYAHLVGHRLWQEGYYERVLRKEDDARKVARYILENPVRAGFVAMPGDYPFLGSDVWTLEELLTSV
jgi:putative transposase